MKHLYKLFTVFILLLTITSVRAQLSGWQYKDAISIQENSGSQKLNYQVLLTVNTQALISMGRMQSNGNDMRFAKDCNGSVLYNYWIESGINTATTQVWVLIDSLPASGTRIMNMFYGNATAPAASSFDLTFPPASRLIVSAGTISLTGVNSYSWFEIAMGATVLVGPNSPFQVSARKIRIDGTLNGDAAGFLGGPTSTNGSGPGYGRVSIGNLGTYGGGGAGYGGPGGAGGGPNTTNYTQTGLPGIAYGTNNTDSTDMGSGGGGGSTGGGNGGGGITLVGDVIEISGLVSADGAPGLNTNLNGGGGGGSGGGIRIKGNRITFTGTFSSDGGKGGNGAYSGGGGAGGRIKIFSDASILNAGMLSVNGGPIGTQNSGTLTALPGSPGTTFTGTWLSKVPTCTILPHVQLSVVGNPSCQGSNVAFTASSGFSNYNFYVGTSSVQNGPGMNYSSAMLNNGDLVKVLATYGAGCIDTSNVITMVVNPLPTVTVSPSSPVICVNDMTSLTAGGATSYTWAPSAGLSATTGAIVNANPTVTTTYTITGTGTGNCTSTATVTVTVNPLPTVTVSPSSPVICVNDMTSLTAGGATSYTWAPSNGLSATTGAVVNATPTATTTYTITGTGTGNCTSTATVTVTVNPLPPAPVITQNGNVLTSTSGTTYQWYQNSTPINGATNQSYTIIASGTYSVCITDANGCSSCSAPFNALLTSITDGLSGNTINIYPNPNTGQFMLTADFVDINNYRVELMNPLGQEIFAESLENFKGHFEKRFDLTGFQAGVYLLILKSEREQVIRKIVIY